MGIITKWAVYYGYLSWYWKEGIDCIRNMIFDVYKLSTIIPRVRSKSKEIIFRYFVYLVYRLTKQAVNCETRRIYDALSAFASSHQLPGDKEAVRPIKLTDEAKSLIQTVIKEERRVTHLKLKMVL